MSLILLSPIHLMELSFSEKSGTTGVACAIEGREFIGIELNEEYFNIASKRIESTVPQLRLL